MTLLVGIAPGPERSGLVIASPDLFDAFSLPSLVEANGQARNEAVADKLAILEDATVCCLVPSRIARNGSLETVLWIGEFRRAARNNRWCPVLDTLLRSKMGALDLNGLRRAVVGRYAPGMDNPSRSAVGTEKYQGPLYGVDTLAWKALATILTGLEHERKSNVVDV